MKKLIVLTLTLTLALSFAACGNSTSDPSAPVSDSSSDYKVVRIASSGQGNIDGLSDNAKLAYSLGYIEEELNAVGYTAEYYGFAQAGPAINEAFASKEIDVAVYAEFPLITATSNGVNIVGFALANSETRYGLFVTEASGIQSMADLDGKSIIVGQGTILQKYFMDMVDHFNLDADSIEQINSLTDVQTLLTTGDADGVIYMLSASYRYEDLGLGHVLEETTSNLDYTSGLVFAGEKDWLAENPDAAAAIVKALNRAQAYAAAHPDEVYELLSSEGLTADVLERTYSYDTSFRYFAPDITEEYLQRAQSVADFMYENGLIREQVDVTTAFDTTYIDLAAE